MIKNVIESQKNKTYYVLYWDGHIEAYKDSKLSHTIIEGKDFISFKELL